MTESVDRLNLTKLYYHIGRLKANTTPDSEISKIVSELKHDLNEALGWNAPQHIDTSPQNDKEAREEHVRGEVLDQEMMEAEDE